MEEKYFNENRIEKMTRDALRDSLLDCLEQKVGTRDTSWKIVETEYRVDGPMTYYPEGYDETIINIRLTRCTEKNYGARLFEMSHEVVHLLNPVEKGEENNLEEGFATWFSVYICERNLTEYNARERIFPNGGAYKKPFELVEKLEDPFKLICNIRKNYSMSKVPKAILKEYTDQKYDEEEINFLLKKFN